MEGTPTHVYMPPGLLTDRDRRIPSIFLGGTIDMGNSHDWQRDFTMALVAEGYKNKQKSFNVFNPRRADWDSSWKQDATNPQFHQQVDWELNAMNCADWIVMHLGPDSRSPISLLEIGLHAHSGKLLVHCPEGFYRKGNVDIVCAKNDIRQFDSLDEIVQFLVQ